MAKEKKNTPVATVPGARKPRRRRDLDAQISSTVFDDFDRFEHFFSTHWKALCGIGAALVAAVAVWGAVEMLRARNHNRAMEALNSANTVQELVAAIDEFGSTDIMANDARLRLAMLLYNAGNFTDAIAQLDAVLATDCPAEQRAQVGLNRAYLFEQSGKLKDAAEAFAAIGASAELPTRDFAAQANYNAGRLFLELKDNAGAEKYLKAAIAGYSAGDVVSGLSMPFWYEQAFYLLNRRF